MPKIVCFPCPEMPNTFSIGLKLEHEISFGRVPSKRFCHQEESVCTNLPVCWIQMRKRDPNVPRDLNRFRTDYWDEYTEKRKDAVEERKEWRAKQLRDVLGATLDWVEYLLSFL